MANTMTARNWWRRHKNPLRYERLRRLLGKEVTVKLGEDVIVQGQFVAFGDGGEFEILQDDGFVHHCWPMLAIEEVRPFL